MIKTPWRQLNALIDGGLRLGLCSTLFGPPGNAKSFFAMNMLVTMIADKSCRPIYIPLEYSKLDHVKRALSVWFDTWVLVSENRNKKAQARSLCEIEGNLKWWLDQLDSAICENPTKAYKDDNGMTRIPIVDYGKMLELVAEKSKRHKLIMIDPLTAIDPDDKARKTEWRQQGEFMRQVKAICEHESAHCMFVTHSGKRQSHNGKLAQMTMDSAAGTADISRFNQYVFILDYHKSGMNSDIVNVGVRQNIDHTRTLILDKVTYGIGSGARLAMDFSKNGPAMDILGMIE